MQNPTYGTPEIQQPSFISSLLCPLQSKLAVFLLRWLIGSTSCMPDLSSHPLGVLSSSCFLVFCNMDRLRIFPFFKFWFP